MEVSALKKMNDDLYFLKNEKEIESKFQEYGITNIKEKLDVLHYVMEVEEVYNSSVDEKVSLENEYKDSLQFFIDSIWRTI